MNEENSPQKSNETVTKKTVFRIQYEIFCSFRSFKYAEDWIKGLNCNNSCSDLCFFCNKKWQRYDTKPLNYSTKYSYRCSSFKETKIGH